MYQNPWGLARVFVISQVKEMERETDTFWKREGTWEKHFGYLESAQRASLKFPKYLGSEANWRQLRERLPSLRFSIEATLFSESEPEALAQTELRDISREVSGQFL